MSGTIFIGMALAVFAGLMGFGGSAGGVTTPTNVTLRGLNASFYAQLKEGYALWKDLCTIVPSTSESEDLAWLSAIRGVREWKDVRSAKPLQEYLAKLVNKHWEDGVAMDRDKLADDKTGMLSLQPKELATRFLQHPNQLLVDCKINGHQTVGPDGQYFYDTDHPGAQSNDLTGEIVDKDNPKSAEFKAAFAQCVTTMMGYKDDEGAQLYEAIGKETMKGLIVCVPLNMLQAATDALQAAVLNNSDNKLIAQAEIVTIPRMPSDTFTVDKTDEPIKPFVFQQRQNFDMKLVDDPHNKFVEYLGDARYVVGYGRWQYSVRYQFTTKAG